MRPFISTLCQQISVKNVFNMKRKAIQPLLLSNFSTFPQLRQYARVQQPAPSFTAQAVMNKEFITTRLQDYLGRWLVLFFYPLDFTFVCPTEIIAFSERADEFKQLNADVMGVSVDSVHSHLAWINTPRREGGLGDMKIPLGNFYQ